MKMNKRAQVALFIIVGLIILLGVTTVVYVKTDTTIKAVEETIDPELVPIQRWVNECVYTIGKEAIKILAYQGGYLVVPEEIANNKRAYIPIDPGDFVKIPFWDFKGQKRIPSIKYMEEQIQDHVKENLLTCIGDFSGFDDLYDIEAGEMIIEADISDENVILDINYPLDIVLKVGGTQRKMNKFGAKLETQFGKMYNLAVKIMEEEQRIYFMENITLDLMSLHPNVPMNGMEFNCNPKSWLISDVKQDTQLLMQTMLPRIRIENTNYLPFQKKISFYENLRKQAGKLREAYEEFDYNDFEGSDSFAILRDEANLPDEIPDDAYDYFHLFIDVDADESDLKVNVRYDPSWGMSFRPLPQNNGFLKSNMARGQRNLFNFFCINQYHFIYDVVYPIMFTLQDENSFAGSGLNFNFGFSITINDNTPDRSDFGYAPLEVPDVVDDFCDTTIGGDPVDITVRGSGDLGFAEELKNVTIGYKCFNMYCELGQTGFLSGTTHYRLSTVLPSGCKFPFLYANKEGYLEGSIQYTGDANVEIPINKIREIPIQVVKNVYQSNGNTLGADEPLGENEKVVITFSVVNGSYDQYVTIPSKDEKLGFLESGGEYTITAMLIREGKIIGKTALPDKLIGGFHNEKLTVSGVDVLQSDAVVFHVFDYRPTPARKTDSGEMLRYLFDSEYVDVISPEYR
tara:strand:+ start:501 stop:2555 length:2055 start_codon:yes stop_codon:yes gene_type:complete